MTLDTSIDDAIAAFARELITHLNDDHDDWVLVVAQGAGGATDAVGAAMVGIDSRSVVIEVRTDGGATRAVTVAFADPVTDVTMLEDRALRLAERSREALGIATPTSLEAQHLEVAAIRTFVTSVVARAEVAAGVVQLTFGGGDLAEFTSIGADQFVYVLAPRPGRRELPVDRSFTWEAWERTPPQERPIGAYYTVRRWRPEAAEMDVLVVLHGDGPPSDEHGGFAAAWARDARPGDPAALWGPRTAFEPPAGTATFLLVADDTGAPAVAAIIEGLPAGTPIVAIVEVDAEANRIDIPTPPGVELRWCFRRGAAPGTTTALLDAVQEAWPPGTEVAGRYAWGGGESRAVTAVRRYLRQDLGMDRAQVSMTGYWRRADDAGDDGLDDSD